jgi:hypothetical protein
MSRQRPAVSDRAVRTVAENLIRDAAERGELDGLPGAGKPLPGLDEPYDPDWWIKRWVRRERLGRELGEALRKLRGHR